MPGAVRQGGASRHVRALVAVGVAILALVLAAPPVRAEERVAVLARMLKSSSEKTRLAAVLSLAKLGDQAAQKPLVTALRDKNTRVRAVAATALGRLECDAALPALRVLAASDANDEVRQAASNAALKIAKSSHQRDERVALANAEARKTAARDRAGIPRELSGAPHAELFLRINSSADDSPGKPDKLARTRHAEIVKRVLTEQCKAEPLITMVPADGQRWGLAARHIDLSVTKLDATRVGAYIEVDAQLRLAISDDNGKMMSFLSGGAKVQVPADKFDAAYLPSLRKEALENAMRGMFGKLLAHLRGAAQADP